MSEIVTKESEWIETTLVPEIAKSIGKSTDDVRCTISFPENCFFISYVCFLDLSFKKSSNQDQVQNAEETLKLVMKKLPLNSKMVDEMNLKKHFHNEILFYTKFATGKPQFPRCVYTNNDAPEETVIVTENLSSQGYAICSQVYDIPMKYVLSAVREIGKFHAAAYVMKDREPKTFYSIVSAIKEPRMNADTKWFDKYVNMVATRPIDWLRRNNYNREFCDKLEKHLSNGFEEILLYAVKPVEPIATLCHGDFTRNNVFFREMNGVLEAKLFDFALITYSSPAVDLSTFLYLNCSAEDRIGKSKEIFHCYHDAVIEHLTQSGIHDLDKYSYEKFEADYRRRAAFGYMIASFFVPMIRNFINVDFDTMLDDPLSMVPKVKEAGGEFLTKIFAEMILELSDLGAFDHVI